MRLKLRSWLLAILLAIIFIRPSVCAEQAKPTIPQAPKSATKGASVTWPNATQVSTTGAANVNPTAIKATAITRTPITQAPAQTLAAPAPMPGAPSLEAPPMLAPDMPAPTMRPAPGSENAVEAPSIPPIKPMATIPMKMIVMATPAMKSIAWVPFAKELSVGGKPAKSLSKDVAKMKEKAYQKDVNNVIGQINKTFLSNNFLKDNTYFLSRFMSKTSGAVSSYKKRQAMNSFYRRVYLQWGTAIGVIAGAGRFNRALALMPEFDECAIEFMNGFLNGLNIMNSGDSRFNLFNQAMKDSKANAEKLRKKAEKRDRERFDSGRSTGRFSGGSSGPC
ncbi:MAG: hypothetical protein NTZ95_00505 [Candidatus Omnitrophica bacterium]|nr:hypothetical protein [Candidatus Omnitrophota bacterium]